MSWFLPWATSRMAKRNRVGARARVGVRVRARVKVSVWVSWRAKE